MFLLFVIQWFTIDGKICEGLNPIETSCGGIICWEQMRLEICVLSQSGYPLDFVWNKRNVEVSVYILFPVEHRATTTPSLNYFDVREAAAQLVNCGRYSHNVTLFCRQYSETVVPFFRSFFTHSFHRSLPTLLIPRDIWPKYIFVIVILHYLVQLQLTVGVCD